MIDRDDYILNTLYRKRILLQESTNTLSNEILTVLNKLNTINVFGQIRLRPSIDIIKSIQKNRKANTNQEKEVENIIKKYIAYMPETHAFHNKSPKAKMQFISTLKNRLNNLFIKTDDILQSLYDALGRTISNDIESRREGIAMGLKGKELKDNDYNKAEADHERYLSDLDSEGDRENEHLFGDEEVEDEDWSLSQMRKNYHQNRQGSDSRGMSIRDEFPYTSQELRKEDLEIIKRIRKLNALYDPSMKQKKPSIPAYNEPEDENEDENEDLDQDL